jgi:NTE family protein
MIAFVFSGGGNRGAVQVGALLTLLERGIRPDLIVGTSVGALNGVPFAADPTLEGARRAVETWQRVRRADVFPGNPLTVGWRILTRQGSLHDRGSFHRFVFSVLPPNVRRFRDLQVPCIVTATVLGTGQLRLFGIDPEERLVDALLASTAIPPFFSPYRYHDEWLVDGAVVANLPLAQAIARGARTIYALDIVDEVAPVNGRSLGQTLSYALRAMISQQDEQERRVVALGRQRGITIHDIKLTAGQRLAYDDFSSSIALIESGRQAAARYLDSLPPSRPVPYRRIALALREAVRSLGIRRAPAAPPPA